MLKQFGRRVLAVLSAAAVSVSVMTVLPQSVSAANQYDVVILGDGVTVGNGLKDSEFPVAGYLMSAGAASTVASFAETHKTTAALLSEIKSGEHDDSLKSAELTVVSIGSYDLLTGLYDFLNSEKAADQTFAEYFKEVAAKSKQSASDAVFRLNTAMRAPRKAAIENVKQIAAEIKSRTSGKIMFLTVYNPFETKSFTYQGVNYSGEYKTLTDFIRGQLKQYNSALNSLEGCLVGDVNMTFRDSGWNYIFSRGATEMEQEDMFPNQLGHAVIAGIILDAAGMKDVTNKKFENILTAKRNTAPFYLTQKARESLFRHAGRKASSPLGDADSSGAVDLKDANCVTQYYNLLNVILLDEEEITDYGFGMNTAQKYAADTNGSGVIELNDASLICWYYNVNVVNQMDLNWDEIWAET